MGSAASKAARDQVRRYPRAQNPISAQTVPKAKPRAAEREPVKEDSAARPNIHDGKDVQADLGVNCPPLGKPADTEIHSDSFSQRLQQMGVVQPNPTFSPSSIASHQRPHGDVPDGAKSFSRSPSHAAFPGSPILSTFEARDRLQRQADADFNALGSTHSGGRHFLDMRHLLDAIRMRESGASLPDIERHLGLGTGLLEKLGKPGVISHISS